MLIEKIISSLVHSTGVRIHMAIAEVHGFRGPKQALLSDEWVVHRGCIHRMEVRRCRAALELPML